MSQDFMWSLDQEITDISIGSPHVVILGAGASRATCPDGDKNGNILPLMNDLPSIMGLKELLEEWKIDPSRNFEDIFSDLHAQMDTDKLRILEEAIVAYFDQLELPEETTVYDYLLLSLREKDLVATFNWDPLLVSAKLRNMNSGLELPRIVFLHGCISIGYCKRDHHYGISYSICPKCGEYYEQTKLLYPIKRKNYANDYFIKSQWNLLKLYMQRAFMVTVFGYSAPKTDQEAITLMQEAWGDKSMRPIETFEFIDLRSEEDIREAWDSFIHSHHYRVYSSFFDSWMANHPRRSGEAYMQQNLEAKFIYSNPVQNTSDLQTLWKWFEKLKLAEINRQ